MLPESDSREGFLGLRYCKGKGLKVWVRVRVKVWVCVWVRVRVKGWVWVKVRVCV